MLTANEDRYSAYCQHHKAEFNAELSAEASRALSGWPCRIAAFLLTVSSLMTFLHPANQENPYLSYTLFTYAIPILIVVSYPFITYLIASLEKKSPVILDIVLISGMLGFLLTLNIVLVGTRSLSNVESVRVALSGQINFALLLATAFAFHSSYYITIIRNITITIGSGLFLLVVDQNFFTLYWLQLLQGFFAGLIFSWIFYSSMRTRFYLKATEADVRQHLYNQLSKLVYPHQLEQIKLGDELENTMPLKEGKAIINVFDVQRSSGIRHEKTQEFFMGVFQAFLEICMKGYEHNPLRSRAFRLKETGDGFISSVGYPFLPTEARSLADSALSTALEMFSAFNQEVKKFGYSRPIKGAMGLAYNSVQGTFQSGGIRSYDLFGDALIQAAKYEELRKQPLIWRLISDHAREIGLEHFNIMIIQETVYNSLSPVYRDLFVEIDLKSSYFSKSDFQLPYDNEARYVYFHLLN
ncbi:MAG: hypothetical protein RLZZ385_482 [Pseudomonadota bacterium]|jgi:hypothetical protein